jgi:hypothetical protein
MASTSLSSTASIASPSDLLWSSHCSFRPSAQWISMVPDACKVSLLLLFEFFFFELTCASGQSASLLPARASGSAQFQVIWQLSPSFNHQQSQYFHRHFRG